MAFAYVVPAAQFGPEMSSFDRDTFDTFETIVFDAAISETYDQTITATTHPVEDGVSISDHSQVEPATYSLSGVISNAPLIPPFDALLSADPDRVKTSDEKLSKMARERLPVYIITGLRVLTPFIITSYSVSRDADIGQRLEVALTLQEIRFVEAQFAAIPAAVVAATRKPAATPTTDAGTQTGTQTTPEDAGLSSFAADGLDGLGNLF